MKKRILSIFISIVLVLSVLPVISSAAELKGQLGFFTTGTALTAGNMRAVCGLSSVPEDEVVFIAAYYLADGTLASFVSDTVTDRKNHYITLTIPDTVSFGDYAKVLHSTSELLNRSSPQQLFPVSCFVQRLYLQMLKQPTKA